ncbi:MAG TPA: oligopeptide/dipeptide ABC transporter ATP-binding protein [Spongiibacteraceae bacterium]|nr:oligopeptide/dipeptide ABC transporter ATP-binding protein [Spongiibacteraceae bacterium]
MSDPLLRVRNLRKYFVQRSGLFKQHKSYVHAVENVSFDIQRGETLGLVGESGCGKSTLGKTLLRLHEPDAGEIIFDGSDIRALSRGAMRPLRKRLQMIFQDPYDSLNSRHTIGDIIEEPLLVHGIGSARERRAAVVELLQKVGLPIGSIERFPHEFSGGQRQRVGIARAIALNPDFVVCDEPLSALDVSVQAQIINLLLTLRASMNLSLLFISHDLSVVRHVSDRVAVMYLGEIVELAPAASIYTEARHPYTQYLIASIPKPQPGRIKPAPLTGEVPSPLHPPSGCRFHTRCPIAQDICRVQKPELKIIASDSAHQAACHFAKP